MKPFNLLVAVLACACAAGADAQTVSAPSPGSAEATAASMTDGEVRKVDKDAGKVTLRHGPIANLGMPGMTMVFKAADPKMLENLKEGDKVRFSADRVDGGIAVTRIQTMK